MIPNQNNYNKIQLLLLAASMVCSGGVHSAINTAFFPAQRSAVGLSTDAIAPAVMGLSLIPDPSNGGNQKFLGFNGAAPTDQRDQILSAMLAINNSLPNSQPLQNLSSSDLVNSVSSLGGVFGSVKSMATSPDAVNALAELYFTNPISLTGGGLPVTPNEATVRDAQRKLVNSIISSLPANGNCLTSLNTTIPTESIVAATALLGAGANVGGAAVTFGSPVNQIANTDATAIFNAYNAYANGVDAQCAAGAPDNADAGVAGAMKGIAPQNSIMSIYPYAAANSVAIAAGAGAAGTLFSDDFNAAVRATLTTLRNGGGAVGANPNETGCPAVGAGASLQGSIGAITAGGALNAPEAAILQAITDRNSGGNFTAQPLAISDPLDITKSRSQSTLQKIALLGINGPFFTRSKIKQLFNVQNENVFNSPLIAGNPSTLEIVNFGNALYAGSQRDSTILQNPWNITLDQRDCYLLASSIFLYGTNGTSLVPNINANTSGLVCFAQPVGNLAGSGFVVGDLGGPNANCLSLEVGCQPLTLTADTVASALNALYSNLTSTGTSIDTSRGNGLSIQQTGIQTVEGRADGALPATAKSTVQALNLATLGSIFGNGSNGIYPAGNVPPLVAPAIVQLAQVYSSPDAQRILSDASKCINLNPLAKTIVLETLRQFLDPTQSTFDGSKVVAAISPNPTLQTVAALQSQVDALIAGANQDIALVVDTTKALTAANLKVVVPNMTDAEIAALSKGYTKDTTTPVQLNQADLDAFTTTLAKLNSAITGKLANTSNVNAKALKAFLDSNYKGVLQAPVDSKALKDLVQQVRDLKISTEAELLRIEAILGDPSSSADQIDEEGRKLTASIAIFQEINKTIDDANKAGIDPTLIQLLLDDKAGFLDAANIGSPDLMIGNSTIRSDIDAVRAAIDSKTTPAPQTPSAVDANAAPGTVTPGTPDTTPAPESTSTPAPVKVEDIKGEGKLTTDAAKAELIAKAINKPETLSEEEVLEAANSTKKAKSAFLPKAVAESLADLSALGPWAKARAAWYINSAPEGTKASEAVIAAVKPKTWLDSAASLAYSVVFFAWKYFPATVTTDFVSIHSLSVKAPAPTTEETAKKTDAKTDKKTAPDAKKTVAPSPAPVGGA